MFVWLTHLLSLYSSKPPRGMITRGKREGIFANPKGPYTSSTAFFHVFAGQVQFVEHCSVTGWASPKDVLLQELKVARHRAWREKVVVSLCLKPEPSGLYWPLLLSSTARLSQHNHFSGTGLFISVSGVLIALLNSLRQHPKCDPARVSQKRLSITSQEQLIA